MGLSLALCLIFGFLIRASLAIGTSTPSFLPSFTSQFSRTGRLVVSRDNKSLCKVHLPEDQILREEEIWHLHPLFTLDSVLCK